MKPWYSNISQIKPHSIGIEKQRSYWYQRINHMENSHSIYKGTMSPVPWIPISILFFRYILPFIAGKQLENGSYHHPIEFQFLFISDAYSLSLKEKEIKWNWTSNSFFKTMSLIWEWKDEPSAIKRHSIRNLNEVKLMKNQRMYFYSQYL